MLKEAFLLLKTRFLLLLLFYFTKLKIVAKLFYALIVCEVAIPIALDVALYENNILIFRMICV